MADNDENKNENNDEEKHPHIDGQLCPECGACTLRFRNYQFNNGKKQEVYDCSYCGQVVMTP